MTFPEQKSVNHYRDVHSIFPLVEEETVSHPPLSCNSSNARNHSTCCLPDLSRGYCLYLASHTDACSSTVESKIISHSGWLGHFNPLNPKAANVGDSCTPSARTAALRTSGKARIQGRHGATPYLTGNVRGSASRFLGFSSPSLLHSMCCEALAPQYRSLLGARCAQRPLTPSLAPRAKSVNSMKMWNVGYVPR